jgi:hypothetical protein
MRNVNGQITRAALRGRLVGGVAEHVMTPDGLTPVKRVEAYLEGTGRVNGGSASKVTINMWWWFRDKVGLPVKFMIEEREDDRLVRRNSHELTAVDVLSLPSAR